MTAIAIGFHFKDIRPISITAMCQGFKRGSANRQNIHAINLFARDTIGHAAIGKRPPSGRTRHFGSHAILVIFNNKHDRKAPQCRHVKAFIDLALIHRAITKIGHADIWLILIFVGKCKPDTDWHLRADNPVTTKEILFAAEHMHRTALAARITTFAARQFSHHTISIHAASQHMAMVTI